MTSSNKPFFLLISFFFVGIFFLLIGFNVESLYISNIPDVWKDHDRGVESKVIGIGDSVSFKLFKSALGGNYYIRGLSVKLSWIGQDGKEYSRPLTLTECPMSIGEPKESILIPKKSDASQVCRFTFNVPEDSLLAGKSVNVDYSLEFHAAEQGGHIQKRGGEFFGYGPQVVTYSGPSFKYVTSILKGKRTIKVLPENINQNLNRMRSLEPFLLFLGVILLIVSVIGLGVLLEVN